MARKLKAALAKYQAEQRAAQQRASKAKHAERLRVEQKAARAARTRAAQADRPAWLPFEDSPEETIVLVGEGDFSFALDLVDKAPRSRVIATGLDTHKEVLTKYGDAARRALAGLAELEVPVLHGVDATQLARCRPLVQLLSGGDSDGGGAAPPTVAFNFPHLGRSVSDQDRNIRQHQELLVAFFAQCRALGARRVVLSLFDGEPYESWQPKRLARTADFALVRSGRFPWSALPHYEHQLTLKGGARTSKQQRQRAARIYLWAPAAAAAADADAAPSAARANDEDEDD